MHPTLTGLPKEVAKNNLSWQKTKAADRVSCGFVLNGKGLKTFLPTTIYFVQKGKKRKQLKKWNYLLL
jgi:hypothetical protein